MFSKNNTKMNNKKQFEKVNHYGIKKFNAGTASVLIASAFLFLGGAAQAADTNEQEATVANTEKVAAEKSTEEKAETKLVVAEKTTEAKEVVEASKTEVKAEAKKEVHKATLQAKISQLDNLFVTLAGQELSEDKQVKTVSAAVELNKAKDLAASASATQEQVDAQVAALEAAINNLSTAEKATDKKEEAKKAEKSETKVAKEELEKAVSEAKVVNQAATTFATKEVKEEAKKAEIKAAVETSEKEITKALDIFNSDSSTKEDVDNQRKELEKAIEAVYVTMQRAGHRGKVEAILADVTNGDKTITGKGVIRNGNTIVTVNKAYITVNEANTVPRAWGINFLFDTSQTQNGDTTTIELKNLAGLGDGFKPGVTKITATDGTVIGEVVSAVTTNSTGSRGGENPFWSQRKKDGKTYEERLAEQPAIPNEVGTTTYTIRWNDNAKKYAITTLNVENITAAGYVAPDIVEDKDYTASISVNGQQVVEHTYTRKATKPNAQKQNTSASIMGDNILGYKGSELIRRSEAIVINTDSDVRYGKGSKFTITLQNDDFTYFKAIDGSKNTATNTNKDDSITYRPANRWSNVKANANNVWILNDGRDTNFTLKATVKSPTELEIEVIDGAIQEGSVLSMDLAKFGVKKEVTSQTFSDEYSKFIYNDSGVVQRGSVVGDTDKTAATLTVSGGTPLNGGEENVTTKVANGWMVDSYPVTGVLNETGAVTLTLVDIETGEEIGYEPTSYNGFARPNEDGNYEDKSILGKKYDVSKETPSLTKVVKDVEYIRVDVTPKGTIGRLNTGSKRAKDIYTAEELKSNGVNPLSFVNNVLYYYVKKTKVEEVNRTIKYVYAEDAKDLAGQQVFEPTTQTVSYTGTIQVNDKNEAQVDANRKPIYINWVGNGDTTLLEVKVPQKEGYIASVEKVAAQPTTATDEDYEFVVTYTPIQKARTTFVYQDKDGNVKQVEGNTPVTETGKGGDKLTKAEEVANKIKEAQNKGYELVSNTYPTDGVFDKDVDTDQEYTVILKERVVPVTPDQPKTPGTPVDPNNPEGPKYPAGLEEKDLNKTVTRTITYVYVDGTPVMENGAPKVVTQEAKFTREAKVNLVTGDVTYGDWTPEQNLAEVKSPEIAKHTVDKATVPTVKVTNASENINEVVTYTPVQKATTTFVYQDKDGNVKQVEGNEPISETGTNGDKLTKAEEIANKIKEAQNKGYELVSNTYPTDGVFDKDVNTDQEFTVTLKERVVPVTPDQPKTPGTPVDPNNPEGPKYPAGLEEKDLNKTVTRTITYVYEDGTPVLNEDGTPKTVTQEAKFTREAKVNLVTGEVTYGDWTPAQDLAEVKSPVVKGFVADKASVAVVNVTADSEDIKEVVTYKPLGSWVPNIPGQPTDPIKYPNNPTDPTKPGTEKPKVPYVPGFTPKDKDGNPLKPVNPNNPEEGYEVPNIPANPGEDTPINYVKDTQKAKTTFVDEKGNPIPGVEAITEEGDSDTPLTKEDEVKAKIKELENKGYELVSNTYPEGGKFDKDKDTDQEFKVTLKAKVVTVTSDQPKTPGTPVDPNNPEGPKYPAGLEEKDLNKTVTRTITYVYEDGTPVLNEDGTPKTVTQEAKFTREAKVNLVTGEVTYGDWTPAQDLAEVKSPVVKGFLADKASVPTVNVTADSKDTTEVVTYKPIGSWIPNIPGQPTNPIKYPNDPQDPTKPGTEKPKVPYVPGFTPKDKDGNPLKPVNPNNPEEGYEVPNIPANPGEDTPINYVANKANLVVKYVDENGKDLAPSETTEGKVGDEYTTTGKVIKGYVLVRVEGEAKGKIGKDGSTVTYVYKPLGSWIPNIPGQPINPIKYPNNPTDPTKPGTDKPVLPYVPGHTPVDGNGQPLKPVDPKDPSKGYITPDLPTDPSQDTPINYVANPQPQPNQDPKPEPKPEPKQEQPKETLKEAPEKGTKVTPVQPKANTQVKRLANTGSTETNTGLAGLGLATIAGLLTAARRRKEK